MTKETIERIDHLRARCYEWGSLGDRATVHRIDALQEIVSILAAELAKSAVPESVHQSSNARPDAGREKGLPS